MQDPRRRVVAERDPEVRTAFPVPPGRSADEAWSPPRAFADADRWLAARGASEEFRRELIEAAASVSAPGRHPLDRIAEAIAARVRVAHLRRSPRATRVLALVGRTGVGKTSTLAKLGARFLAAGRSVSLASLDGKRVGATAQLGAYAKLLGVRARVVPEDAPIDETAVGVPGPEVVLLDTTGRLPRDVERLCQLERAMARGESGGTLESLLVLPATSSREAVRETVEAVQDLRFAGCIVTKVDETRTPVPVLEELVRLDLPIAFITNGQDLARSLARASGEVFADLCLRGRTS